jgi:predicted nucleotidyltransferase component of viral defense system
MAIVQDKGASILAQLKNKAKASNISYQQCLQLFFQEEFLRRLAKSPYAKNFILKGGLFIYTLTSFQSRATVDIDFLMQNLSNEKNKINGIITEITSIPTGFNDVVILEAGKTKPIAVQMKYQGVSTQIVGHIKKVRLPFNIDIGIGDVVVPKPEKRIIETQLEGYDAPEIYTYSLESTIAEKFDAMLQRFELTSRMKDFYDIFYLAHTFDFEGQRLQNAFSETLRNRRTPLNKDSLDRIVQLVDDAAIQVRWKHFQKIMSKNILFLSDVMQTLDIFLQPVCEAVILGTALTNNWNAKSQEWG